MITTIIFDMDDTLYDEVDYCRSGFSAVADFLAKEPQMPPADRLFDCLWKQFSSGNHLTTFNTALDQLGVEYDKTFISRLVKVYRSHVPSIKLPPDSENILDQLAGKYTLGLLTDGFLPAQWLKVRALGIEKYFQAIIYTEQLGREFWKPSPAGFEKIMLALNAQPENSVYVADNEKKDFIAPNKLGILSIQLTRPARIHKDTSADPNASPAHVIKNITELPRLLDNL